jgi:hypothetical protein
MMAVVNGITTNATMDAVDEGEDVDAIHAAKELHE